MLHVRRIANLEELRALTPYWNALLDPADPYAVFLRHEWVSSWFDAYGGGSEPYVLVATSSGRLCGVLPLRRSQRRFAGVPLRRLDLMANGHSPCADLLAATDSEGPVREAFASFLQEAEADWDLAVLAELQAGSELAQLSRLFPADLQQVRPQRRAPFLALEGGWDDYTQGLSKGFLKLLRRNRNRVARHASAHIELLERPGDVEAGLHEAFAISERSWQGAEGSGIGSNAENRSFYASIVNQLGQLGLVRLWFLRLGGRRVAFELHVVHGGVEFGLKTGYDLEFEGLSIGTYLDQHIVQHLLEEKRCREYDLLGEADFYKLRWTHSLRDYVRVMLFGGGFSARAMSLWNRRLLPMLKARAMGEVGGAVAAVLRGSRAGHRAAGLSAGS